MIRGSRRVQRVITTEERYDLMDIPRDTIDTLTRALGVGLEHATLTDRRLEFSAVLSQLNSILTMDPEVTETETRPAITAVAEAILAETPIAERVTETGFATEDPAPVRNTNPITEAEGVRWRRNDGGAPAVEIVSITGRRLHSNQFIPEGSRSRTPASFEWGDRGQLCIKDGDVEVWLNNREVDVLVSLGIYLQKTRAGITIE